MKMTIICRFAFPGIELDNGADCRLFFLLEKRAGQRGVVFYTLLFDKVVGSITKLSSSNLRTVTL